VGGLQILSERGGEEKNSLPLPGVEPQSSMLHTTLQQSCCKYMSIA